ncbi:disulfide-like protein [Tieghemostelium lacteum]|uniref:Disulfide-like protein n=1 Tax=Tieghemostelium lacteum TaxID=361077 RepID=A0A151ZB21_TIELA|nr:disulfide-like protein [Tieghemostelium lacteum]|eukprot:KYQ91147.1 disulfide-like protein [Tieghemostelium lacteum]
MNCCFYFLIVFAFLFNLSYVIGSDETTSNVIVLTDKTFNSEMNGLIMVEFYAPWCGHCKKLAPIYEELATKLKTEHPNVKIAKVDCDVEKASCKRFDITSFPTLKLIDNDNKVLYDFKQERSLTELTTFITGGYLGYTKSKLPRDKSIAVQGSYQNLVDGNFTETVDSDNWLVYFYIPTCRYCKIYAPKFEDVAADYFEKGYNFAKINCDENPNACDLYQITGYPTIKYIDSKSSRVKEFYQEPSYENLEYFIKFGQMATPGHSKPLFNNFILTLVEEAVKEFVWVFIVFSFIFGFAISYILFGMTPSTPNTNKPKPVSTTTPQPTPKPSENKKNK